MASVDALSAAGVNAPVALFFVTRVLKTHHHEVGLLWLDHSWLLRPNLEKQTGKCVSEGMFLSQPHALFPGSLAQGGYR